jgi:WD repeat-containing protein 61
MLKLEYSLKNAHNEGIWSCDWGEKYTMNTSSNRNTDQSDNNDEKTEETHQTDCIVTGSMDQSVKIWSYDSTVPNLQLHHSLEGAIMAIISVVLNSDATIVASSSLDTNLYLWDTLTGTKLKTITTEPLELWTLVFSPDDKYVLSGSHNGKIIAYNIQTGKHDYSFDTKGIYLFLFIKIQNYMYDIQLMNSSIINFLNN